MNTWGLFFSWPAGGTWSNMIASLEWVVVAGITVWCFRDRLGRRLAAWWHKHHKEHLRAELDQLKTELLEHLKRDQ